MSTPTAWQASQVVLPVEHGEETLSVATAPTVLGQTGNEPVSSVSGFEVAVVLQHMQQMIDHPLFQRFQFSPSTQCSRLFA